MEPLGRLSLKPRGDVCWHFFTQPTWLIAASYLALLFPLRDRQTDRHSLSVVLKQESSCLQNKHCLWEAFHYINKPEVFFRRPSGFLLLAQSHLSRPGSESPTSAQMVPWAPWHLRHYCSDWSPSSAGESSALPTCIFFLSIAFFDMSAEVTPFKRKKSEQKDSTCARRYLNYAWTQNDPREALQLSPCWWCLRVIMSRADTSAHKRGLVESSAAIEPLDLGKSRRHQAWLSLELSAAPAAAAAAHQRLKRLQTVIRGPPRGPEGFRLTKSRACALTANLCRHTGKLKNRNKTKTKTGPIYRH